MEDAEYEHTHCIGMFPVAPKHEPEVIAAKVKQFEKIQHPVMEPVIDVEA